MIKKQKTTQVTKNTIEAIGKLLEAQQLIDEAVELGGTLSRESLDRLVHLSKSLELFRDFGRFTYTTFNK